MLRKVVICFASFALVAFIIAGLYTGYLFHKADRMLHQANINGKEGISEAKAQGQMKDQAQGWRYFPIFPEPDVRRQAYRQQSRYMGSGIARVSKSPRTKPVTLLLMGVDYRKQSGTMNTDVIMALALNPESKSATLVSLPRDLQLNPRGLPSRKANFYYSYFKAAAPSTAYARTKKVFSDFLGIPIDYMVTVDFRGFEKVIDVLGGLTLDVDMDMKYVDSADGTNINLRKGVQKLSGEQALDFVRYRKSNRHTAESSDHARNKRQQQVLGAIFNEMKTFGGITKLGRMMDAMGNHLGTDLEPEQIRSLFSTYYGMEPEQVQYIPLNGAWISPYIVVKKEDLNWVRQALYSRLSEAKRSDPSAYRHNERKRLWRPNGGIRE